MPPQRPGLLPVAPAARLGRVAARKQHAEADPSAFAPGLEDFLEALRVEAGLSRNTLLAYRSDLERFVAFSCGRDLGAWTAIETRDVIEYLRDCRAKGLAEATVARRLSAIRMCLRHLFQEGELPRNAAAEIPAPVLRRSLPTTLSIEDVEQLLAAPGSCADPTGWSAQRDTAFLEVLYACGARVSEAAGLRTDAIEPSLRVLMLHGKGRKTRVVPLGERARLALEVWLTGGRKKLPGAERRAEVFLTKTGRPMDRSTAWRRVKAAALTAGLSPDISPHTLRHSFASHLIEGGADLRSVQEMLGHASIRTTEIYTHLDVEHVMSLHRLYHPRG